MTPTSPARGYEPTEGWGELPEGWSFVEATSVAVDSEDRVYIFNRGTRPVIVLDRAGDLVASWGEGLFEIPHGVTATADGLLWLTDYADHTIRCFTHEGDLVATLGESGVASPPHSGEPFNGPTDIAQSPLSGDLFVSDGYGNSAVHRYSADGRHILSWGQPGTGPGHFNIPHNIEVGPDGHVFVNDRENHRIQVFDERGNYLDQINNLHRPSALLLDTSSEVLFVGELPTRLSVNAGVPNIGASVTVLSLAGEPLIRLGGAFEGEGPGEFIAPHGVAVDSTGALYVAEVSFRARGRHEIPPREPRSLQKFVPRQT